MKKILLTLSIAFAMLFVFNTQSAKAVFDEPGSRYVFTYYGTDWNGGYFMTTVDTYVDASTYGPSVCIDIVEYVAYDNYENVYWAAFVDENGVWTTYDYSGYPPFSN